MKLRYRRSGGFANIATTVELDSAKLPKRKAAEIRSLVEEAGVFDLPVESPKQAAAPDDLEHLLEITDGSLRRSLHRCDSQCGPELMRLFDRLQEEATTKPRRARRSRS